MAGYILLHFTGQKSCSMASQSVRTVLNPTNTGVAGLYQAYNMGLLCSVRCTAQGSQRSSAVGTIPVTVSRCLHTLIHNVLWSQNVIRGSPPPSRSSKWKFRRAGILLKSETRIKCQKNGKRQMDIEYILINNFMCILDILFTTHSASTQSPLRVFLRFVLSQ
jgi:hypothetical protein